MINISYFQARSLPSNKRLTKQLASDAPWPNSLTGLKQLNFEKMAEQQLFDAEVTRTGLYRQLASQKGLSLEPEDLPAGMKPEVTASLLISSTGFFVVGITISVSDPSLADWLVEQAAPAYISKTAQGNWSFEFGGTTISFKGGVRDALEILGLCIHDKLMKQKLTSSLISHGGHTTSKDTIHLEVEVGSCSKHIKFDSNLTRRKLFKKSKVNTRMISSFGYHCEVEHDFKTESDPRQSQLFVKIDQQRTQGIAHTLAAKNFKTLFATDHELWLTTGLESIRFAKQFTYLNDDNKKYNLTTSASFMEYIAYRRGILGILQYTTQQFISERKTVSSGQLDYWNWLLGSTADDFSIGRNVDVLLACKREAEHNGVDHFDLQHLEQQTRSSIDSFTSRVDIKQANSAIFLGILFGLLSSITLFELLDQSYKVSSFISIPVVAVGLVVLIVAILYTSRRLRLSGIKPLLSSRRLFPLLDDRFRSLRRSLRSK